MVGHDWASALRPAWPAKRSQPLDFGIEEQKAAVKEGNSAGHVFLLFCLFSLAKFVLNEAPVFAFSTLPLEFP